MQTPRSRPNFEIWLFALCASGLFALWPGIDLWASHLFFTAQGPGVPAEQGFIGLRSGLLRMVRDVARVLPVLILLGLLAAWLAPLALKQLPRLVSTRQALFAAAAMALGPGLLVNGGFKSFSGRARPIHIEEFGGSDLFSPAWTFSDQCHRNCSFVSGEVSTATWTFALFLIAPAALKPAALLFALGYMVLSPMLRMAAGAHFLSDTVVSVILTQLITLALFALFFRAGRDA